MSEMMINISLLVPFFYLAQIEILLNDFPFARPFLNQFALFFMKLTSHVLNLISRYF